LLKKKHQTKREVELNYFTVMNSNKLYETTSSREYQEALGFTRVFRAIQRAHKVGKW